MMNLFAGRRHGFDQEVRERQGLRVHRKPGVLRVRSVTVSGPQNLKTPIELSGLRVSKAQKCDASLPRLSQWCSAQS